MSYNRKIEQAMKNQEFKNRLLRAGVYPIVGSAEPHGNGLKILDSYNTLDELKRFHPTGKSGDCYIVGGILYVWTEEYKSWKEVGNIVGPKGEKGDVPR